MKLITPCCHRQVTSADFMLHATINIKRTCPKCKTRYSVTIRPRLEHEKGLAIHIIDWFRTEK